MKKLLMVFCFIVCLVSVAYAADASVQINGEIVKYVNNDGSNANAQIINGRTMVPIRKTFTMLGVKDENILWDGATSTAIAIKDNIEIRVQVGNNIAIKKVDGIENKITLDSPAVNINDRVLVPLRFIAESLGKQVGWDAANRTAIIIDYDYFTHELKQNFASLYNFLENDSSNVNVSITRNYYDMEDSKNNNTAVVSAQITESKSSEKITQNVAVKFSGTNDLMKEINSEGWGEINYENNYYEDYFTTKALNDGLKKVYGQEEMTFKYKALNADGKYNASLVDTFKVLCDINENSINTQTFASRKDEFSSLVKILKTNGNIHSSIMNLNYFDITKFDNIIYDSALNRVYSFLNSQIFNFDVNLETLCYDYNVINSKISALNNELNIDITLTNEYNEKVQYIIKINK